MTILPPRSLAQKLKGVYETFTKMRDELDSGKKLHHAALGATREAAAGRHDSIAEHRRRDTRAGAGEETTNA